jgi:hypothetical protein
MAAVAANRQTVRVIDADAAEASLTADSAGATGATVTADTASTDQCWPRAVLGTGAAGTTGAA